MKPGMPEMVEGSEAYKRFETAMKGIIAVPRAKVQARIEDHRKQAALNPNKRGPKRKANPPASHDPAV